MRNYLFFLLAVLGIAAPNAPAWSVSGMTNGLCVAVCGQRGPGVIFVMTEPIRFNDELVWGAFSTNGEVELMYPNPDFGIMVRMWGPDGKEVRRTALGKTYGSKFDEIGSYRPGRAMGHVRTVRPLSPHEAEYGFPARFLPAPDPEAPFRINRATPKDLFKIKKPGIYTLEIQMQMFVRPYVRKIADYERVLVASHFCFPQVRIKVEKPPDKSENLVMPKAAKQ